MSQKDTLAQLVRSCYDSFERFLEGFDEENRTAQAPDMPNHAAWTLGHLSLVVSQVACMLDEGEMDEDFFVVGKDRTSPPQRYDTNAIAFGSTPVDDPSAYPSLARGKELFAHSMQRLERAVARLDDARLEETFQLGPWRMTLTELIGRVTCHNMIHAGQLIDLRRAHGFDPVEG
jgi:hypothetical protein